MRFSTLLNRFDYFAKRRLIAMLDGKFKFRKASTLAAAINRGTTSTELLLMEIGARPSTCGHLWGLFSRVGVTKTPEQRLRKLLSSSKYRFRSLGRLSSAVNFEVERTKSLLREIGARPSRYDSELWGLVSRIGVARRGYA